MALTIITKSRQPATVLPDWFYEIKFPVRAILEPYAINVNWRWRMAAREMMSKENVLSLATIQSLFNKFFRDEHKLFGEVLDRWMTRPDAKKRWFGVTRTAYLALDPAGKNNARKQAKKQLQERFGAVFQRRHDCIHNCDSPRVSPQLIVLGGTVIKVIEDVEFLVNRCDEHINTEFRAFLREIGCSGAIIAQAGY